MRIYSTEDLLEGKFPQGNDFPEAFREFEESAVFPFIGNQLIGGFGYGSFRRGDWTITSDIDYFMISSSETHLPYMKIIRKATRNAVEDHNVMIQTRVIPENRALSGHHNSDDSFIEHLQFSVDRYGFHGKNPLEVLAANGKTFEEGLSQSMTIYLTKLEKFSNYPLNEEEYLDFLKDVMQKPFHAVRVAVQAKAGSVFAEGLDYDDTKSCLIRLYRDLEIAPDLEPQMNRLVDVSREYVRTIEAIAKGEISQEDIPRVNEGLLRKIFECYEDAYSFIEGTAERVGLL